MSTSEPSDDYSLSTAELAECAKINFQNLADLVPALKSHPFFMIAKDQLDVVTVRLARKEGITR